MRVINTMAILAATWTVTAFPSFPLGARNPGGLPAELMASIKGGDNKGANSRRDSGNLPAELLADIESTDDAGSNSKRQVAGVINSGGFNDLPEELRQHLNPIQKRDKRLNCGSGREGDVKTWVPVTTWIDAASIFCTQFANRPISFDNDCASYSWNDPRCNQGYVWGSYNVALTPRNGATHGDPAHISFYIHNSKQSPSGSLTYDDCMTYQQKQSNWPDAGGASACWGKDNNDTKGGAWIVDSLGDVGGYIYSGSVQDPVKLF